MDLVLEEEFLEILVHFFKTLPMADIWQNDARQGDAKDQETEIAQSLQVGNLPHHEFGLPVLLHCDLWIISC